MTSPAALAALAIDPTFSTWGIAAVYTPPGNGAGVACTVIRDLQDQNVSFGAGRPFAEGRILEVRACEIPTPVKGGIFTIETVALKIVSDPETSDPDRLVWRCVVA
jgi:hypothetical protein